MRALWRCLAYLPLPFALASQNVISYSDGGFLLDSKQRQNRLTAHQPCILHIAPSCRSPPSRRHAATASMRASLKQHVCLSRHRAIVAYSASRNRWRDNETFVTDEQTGAAMVRRAVSKPANGRWHHILFVSLLIMPRMRATISVCLPRAIIAPTPLLLLAYYKPYIRYTLLLFCVARRTLFSIAHVRGMLFSSSRSMTKRGMVAIWPRRHAWRHSG